MISWVLLVFLNNSPEHRQPVALPATSQAHCERLGEEVKSLKGFSSATCWQLSTYVDVIKQLPTKEK